MSGVSGLPRSFRVTVTHVQTVVTLWAGVIMLIIQLPFLAEPYRIDDDVMQHAYWLLPWQTDLSTDLLACYSTASNPLTVRLFYSAIRRFVDPLLVIKLFPIGAGMIGAYLVAGTAARIGGVSGALLAGLLFPLHVCWRDAFWFGVANAGDMGPLLLLGILWAVHRRCYGLNALLCLVQAFIYPPLFLLSAGASLLLYGVEAVSSSAVNRWLLSSVAVGIGMVYLGISYGQQGTFGPMATGAALRSMPEFGERGRTALVYPDLIRNIRNCRSGVCLTGSTLYLGALAAIGLLLTPRRARLLTPGVRAYLLSSALLYGVARVFMLRLYEPSRFVKFDVPVFLVLWAASGLGPWLRRTTRWVSALSIVGLVSSACWVYSGAIGHWGVEVKDKELYSALRELPHDSVIVGHPFDLDPIPLFAQRRILLSHELAMPYLPGFYEQVKGRTTAFFEAYFAADPDKVRTYLEHCGATHLLVAKRHFTEDYARNGEPGINPHYGKYYFEPFEQVIAQLVAPDKAYVLAAESLPGVIYDDAEYRLLRLK